MSRVLPAVLTLLAALLIAPPPARADLQHPRQAFLRDSTAGLFLHWGQRTSPQHTDCAAWEADVVSGGWTPAYWVNEAKKLHAQYIVLATFHSRLGYARPYPSSIPGSCRTSRDFLGELIDAADAQGLKVINYMTDDPQWHNEGLSSGDWLNSAAFSSHVGRTVDLTTRDGFGEFSYLQFFEQMRRYPKLAGFWIDNDNAYWERNDLYAKIYQQRPDMTISNNNEDTPIMDMISNEQKTGMTPSYDYPQAIYTALPRLIEADFKLPTAGPWWYGGSDQAVDRKLTLGRLITNAGSSVKALMAETAMVNGRFPAQQAGFNNFANTYLSEIWESLGGTEGGGYMYGGLKPGFWNDGAHGVTTIAKNDPNRHYVHVLTPPTGGTLSVRDNGYRISSVTNLRTGAAVPFTQSGGSLRLTGITSWDPYDTVFKVVSSGREGIHGGVTLSAGSSTSGHAASAAGDGDYLTYWDSNAAEPARLTFDLGSAKRVQYLAFNQREDSTVHPASGSARISGYQVHVSDDGTNWGSAVKTGTVPNARGVQFIDLTATTARYVRLTKTGHHGIARWRVDEAWAGGQYAAGATEPPPGRHEAEDATISQGVFENTHTGFSGTGYVNGDNVTGSYVQWAFPAETTGTATVRLRYANGTTANRPMTITVGGTTITRDFNGTGAWTTWATDTFTVPVAAGSNTLRATATTANGNPNIDYIDVSPGAVMETASDNGLSIRPAMGWSSWSFVRRTPTEAKMKAQADALVSSGLAAKGYVYVNLDDFYQKCDANGYVVDGFGRWAVDTAKFPGGIKALADYVHAKGLKFGFYVTPGIAKNAVTANRPIEGTSYHAQDIADTSRTHKNYNCKNMYRLNFDHPGAQAFIDSWAGQMASWGVDYLKIDGVDATTIADVEAWDRALRRTGRPINFALSNNLPIAQATTWKRLANSWRTQGDVECYCGPGPNGSGFPLTDWAHVVSRFNSAASWQPYAGPGGWNDYDSLEIGNGDQVGLTADQRRSHMTHWAMAASPLLLGTDLTALTATDLSMLTNDRLIAVNQDGVAAQRIVNSGVNQVWRKRESNGDHIIALYNTGTSGNSTVSVTWSQAGFTGPAAVTNLWSGASEGTVASSYSATLRPGETRLIRARPATAVPRYEAENATISQGAAESNHAGYSGTGFVNYDNLVGSYVEFTVNAAQAGNATVTLRYANGTTANRPMTITVGGTTITRDYNGTGAWATWATDTFTLPLTAGANTVRATATTAGGGPNVDYIDVS